MGNLRNFGVGVLMSLLLATRQGMAVKRYQLAATSLSYQSKQFFRTSSLHGVRYITETDRPFLEKFLWACCIGVGSTVAMIIIISVWEKFQTNPTITGLDTNFHNWDVPFPGVSLCQNDPVDYKRLDDLITNYVEDKEQLREYLSLLGRFSRREYKGLSKYSEMKDFPLNDFKAIVKETIFSNCAWKGMEKSCCDDMFFPIFTENGFCYSFSLDENQGVFLWNGSEYKFEQELIYETDARYAIEFQVANVEENKVQIGIHSSDELPSRDIKFHHEWDGRIGKLAFSDKTTYTTQDTRQLSVQQRHCVFPDEQKVFTNQDYTYNGCMLECRIQKTVEKCSCVPFIYNHEVQGFGPCDLNGLVCFEKNTKYIMSASGCNCELSCETSVYEVEMLTEAVTKDGPIEVGFVSFPVIRYKREVLFGWADLLVSFGGIAGLFLGFSLLAGVETLYFFTMRAWCMVLREEETLEKIQRELDAEEKPILDLSLTPYFMKKTEEESEIIVPRLHHIRPIDERHQILF